MKKLYELTVIPTKTITATARYGHKIFRKGKEYTIRRKLDAEQLHLVRLSGKHSKWAGYKLLKAKVI